MVPPGLPTGAAGVHVRAARVLRASDPVTVLSSLPVFSALGLSPFFLSQLDPDVLAGVFDPAAPLRPGRLCFLSRDRGLVLQGPGPAQPVLLPARLIDPDDPLLVGDWVVVDSAPPHDPPVVRHRLRRSSLLRRRAPGGGIQPMAANVDLALVCTALGADLSVRRAERWLALCHEAGIPALVVLTKADPGVSLDAARAAFAALDTELLAVSALHGTGLSALRERLAGQTATLLGSSGVGKTTLRNALCDDPGEATAAVRPGDDKGRHTTTARRLWRLASGGLLVDNPGVREVGLVDEEGVAEVFPEIEALLGGCRWRDCGHGGDAGCAVDEALAAGTVSPERVAAWRQLQREAAFEARRTDAALQRAEEKRWRRIQLDGRARNKLLGKGRRGH